MTSNPPTANRLGLAVLMLLVVAVLSLFWFFSGWLQLPIEAPPSVEPSGRPELVRVATEAAAPESHQTPLLGLRIDASGRGEMADLGTVVVEAVWSDGAPAAGLMISVSSRLANAARMQELAVAADEAGRAVFTDVRCGPIGVRSDRGDYVSALVRRGEETRVRLQVKAGLSIHGRVENAHGKPVPGALIWLTRDPTGSWLSGRFVTQAGTDGAFWLRDVSPEKSIGAVAAGFCPSPFVDLEAIDTSDPNVWVDLRLTEPGGEIVVQVVDPDGRPVSAIVAVGDVDQRPRTLTEDPRGPRTAPTDEAGRCVMAGMAPGDFPVEVRSSEWPMWRGSAHVEVGRTTELRVTLAQGATVEGVVRSPQGLPIPNVLVVALPCKTPGNSSLGGENLTAFSHPAAISGTDGAFVLHRVPPGEVHLLARAEPRGSDAGARPWTETSLNAGPGQTLRWDAVLDPGLSIQGIVRRRSGQSVDGAVLTLTNQGTTRTQRGFSDANGRFTFLCLGQGTYDLTVLAPNRLQTPLVERGITPSHAVVEVVVDDEPDQPLATGMVRGRVVDGASRLRQGVRRWAVLRGGGQAHKVELDNDAFRFLDVAAGEYVVSIQSGDDCVLRSEPFDLAPAQDLSLGDLITTAAATVVVELDRWPGTQSREVSLRLVDVATGIQYLQEELRGTRATFDNVVPGSYVVELEGRLGLRQTQCASGRCDVVVAPGGAAICSFAVRPAVVLHLQLEFPPGHVVESIVCAEGLRWKCVKTPRQTRTEARTLACSISVPFGALTISARTKQGAQGTCETIVVEGTEPGIVTLRLQ